MSEGWIRLYRSTYSNSLFEGKPFGERDAWHWLLTKACWKQTTHRVGKDTHVLERGCMFYTLRQLRDAWNWKSDFKVRAFLDELLSEGMITICNNARKTQISICNYSEFQDEKENATQEKRKDNAKITQEKRTKEEVNNLRKEDIEEIDKSISLVQPIANAQTAPEKPKKIKINELFEKFKNAYPKRDSQIPWQPALKKFEALVKSGEPPDKIIEGAARYCAEQQRLGNFGTKFVRLPVVFLNQSQWKEYSQIENLLNFNDGLKTALSPPFGHKQQPLRGIALIQHNRMIKENEQLKQAN